MSSAPAVRPSRRSSSRLAGLGALLAVLALALLAPGATLANDLHQSPPISWDARGFRRRLQGRRSRGRPGAVALRQTQTDASSGTLHVTFQTAGSSDVVSSKHTGGVLHWNELTTGARRAPRCVVRCRQRRPSEFESHLRGPGGDLDADFHPDRAADGAADRAARRSSRPSSPRSSRPSSRPSSPRSSRRSSRPARSSRRRPHRPPRHRLRPRRSSPRRRRPRPRPGPPRRLAASRVRPARRASPRRRPTRRRPAPAAPPRTTGSCSSSRGWACSSAPW